MHAGAPADVYMVGDHHVTTQRGMTAHDEMIPDLAVMSDVTVGQKHVVRADARLVFGIGRNMSSHVFAKDVPVAYFSLGLPPATFRSCVIPPIKA